ncbi:MAG: enoyl-CoA hydratase/carnithine racemase [Alteromonadaceae bacterium]|jgi:enoyl-CoA hydratase/carnithine racemase
MTDVVLYRELDTISDKKIGIATLNSAKSLNALSLDMVKSLLPKLIRWQEDPTISMVILQGAGEKGFCAGGDIRDLYAAMTKNPGTHTPYLEEFFTNEYQLDYLIHTFDKPLMVWGQGIVMGGGLGLMAGASHRVVTESSRIAMPEISIGLYPDVGGSYFLNQMPKGCGLFLGLTGASINAADAKHIKLADFFVAQDKKEALIAELVDTKWGDTTTLNHQKLNDVVHRFESESLNLMPQGNVQSHGELITQVTSHEGVEAVVDAILAIDAQDKWMSRAQQSLSHGSAITAHIVHKQLHLGKDMTLAESFRFELGVSVRCGLSGEFAEGIRALLIEKDNQPKWRFSSVHDVDPEVIAAMFISPWSEQTHPLKGLGK